MTPPALFRLAFRPLFLLGAGFSVLAVGWWTLYWTGIAVWSPYGGSIWWHGHEMLFGFGAAIAVGFLLTAVQNWTGVPGLSGTPLMVLVGVWLLARLAILFGGPPGWSVALLDSLFLALGAVALAHPILRTRQWHNLGFPLLLLLLLALNLASHWGVLSLDSALAMRSLHAAILAFGLLIAAVGGRVIPFFTSAATATPRRPGNRALDAACVGSLLALTALALHGFDRAPPLWSAALCVLAGAANLARAARWQPQLSLRIPLLWSLHLSHAFLPLGLLLLAAALLGWLPLSNALHALTIGAMGGMMLAMMARVSLGHTGRPLQLPDSVALGFVALLLCALVRALWPGWPPAVWSLTAAGVLWVFGYTLFLVRFAPMLTTPRVDGKPG